jgi:hypothetical protein
MPCMPPTAHPPLILNFPSLESLSLRFLPEYVPCLAWFFAAQTVPTKIRDMLHLTAKSTQFGKKTFTSWLIEAAGTVPIERRKDFAGGMINNDAAMAKLTQVRAFISHAKIFLTSCRPWRWAMRYACSRRARVGITLLLLLSRQEVRTLE